MQAHTGEGVERPDRRPGGDQLDVGRSAVGAHRGDELTGDEVEELSLEPGLVSGVALAGEDRPPVDAVDRVQLHPAGVEQLGAGRDKVEALDLLGVAACRGEHERRPAVVAPAHDVDLAFEPVGVPARRQLGCSSAPSVAPALDPLPEQVGEEDRPREPGRALRPSGGRPRRRCRRRRTPTRHHRDGRGGWRRTPRTRRPGSAGGRSPRRPPACRGTAASESAISKYGVQSRFTGIGRFVAAQKIDQRRLAATSHGKW